MKKTILFLLFTSSFFNCLIAQQFSFSLETGYQFKLASGTISEGDLLGGEPGNRTFGIAKYTLGKGTQFVATAMYRVNEKFELGLGVNYLLGSTHTASWREYQNKLLRFNPQAKFYITGEKVKLSYDYRCYSCNRKISN